MTDPIRPTPTVATVDAVDGRYTVPDRRARGRRHADAGTPPPWSLVQVRAGDGHRDRLDLRPAGLRRRGRATCSPAVVAGRTRSTSPAPSTRWSRAVRNAGRAGAGRLRASPRSTCALWDLKARLLGLPLHRLLGAVRDDGARSTAAAASPPTTTRQLRDAARRLGDEQQHPPRQDQDRRVVGHRGRARPGPDAPGPRRDRRRRRAVRRRQRRLHAQAGGPGDGRPPTTWTCAGSRSRSPPTTSPGCARSATPSAPTSPPASTATTSPTSGGMCAAGAVDCLQADATRCGGITEWLRVAAVAAAHGLEVSGHCAPAPARPRRRGHPQPAAPGVVPRPRPHRATVLRRHARPDRAARCTRTRPRRGTG